MALWNTLVVEIIVLIARLCLGFFLLPSAVGKLAKQDSFIQGIGDYNILPKHVARVFGAVLPWVELSIGLALISGIALPIAGIAASLLFTCFIVAVAINLRRGREIECNCYGVAGTRTISWGTIARNILLLLLAISIVGLAPNVVTLAQWLDFWQENYLIAPSISSVILLFFLFVFSVVSIYLIEWSIDIHYRVSRFNVYTRRSG